MSETRKFAAILVEYSRLAGLLLAFLSPAARAGAAPRRGYASGSIGGRPEQPWRSRYLLADATHLEQAQWGAAEPGQEAGAGGTNGERQALPFERVVSRRLGP